MLLASGTDALQVAIRHATAHNSRIALPAFVCYAVASAAVASGRGIELYDIDPVTLGPDPDSLDRALARGCGAAVVAPLFGLPVDWDWLEDIARPRGVTLIEDAAQGDGARWRGREHGSLGRLSVLSFGRGKGWTGVRGGAVLFNGEAPVAGEHVAIGAPGAVMGLRVAVDALALWMLMRPSLFGIPASLPFLNLGETLYHDSGLPRAAPRLSAALLEYTHQAAMKEAQARRENARRLQERLTGAARAGLATPIKDAEPGYLRLPIRLPKGMDSLADAKRARRLGIAPTYPAPIGELAAVKPRLSATQESFSGARELARTLITAPTHSRVSAADLDALVELLNRSA